MQWLFNIRHYTESAAASQFLVVRWQDLNYRRVFFFTLGFRATKKDRGITELLPGNLNTILIDYSPPKSDDCYQQADRVAEQKTCCQIASERRYQSERHPTQPGITRGEDKCAKQGKWQGQTSANAQ